MHRAGRGERGAVRVDPRLVIGALLVAGSAAGVWALVDGLDTTTRVYAVATTVPTGARIEASDLVEVAVRIGGAADRYLAAGEVPGEGLVAKRTIGAGELVPRSAVGGRAEAGLAAVVVPAEGALPTGAGPGALVDVWSAKRVAQGEVDPPRVLVSGAEISALLEPEGLGAGGSAVELLVPRERVAALLQALAAGDSVDLVGVGQAAQEEAAGPAGDGPAGDGPAGDGPAGDEQSGDAR